MFFNLDSQINNKTLIFDKTYKNIFQKQILDQNNTFFYYKTLSKIKHKFQKKLQFQLAQNIFRPQSVPKKFSTISRFKPNNPDFPYNIEKINSKMFRIQKNGSNERNIFSLQRPYSRTIELHNDWNEMNKEELGPQLEQIVTKHRNLHNSYKSKKREYLKDQIIFGDYYKSLRLNKVKTKQKTMG